jgi:nicotinate-nucleotide adenylyltransferase
MSNLIGVYGGTFDPPHLGHLILAAEALSQLGLQRLLWMLTPDPPHKPGRPITVIQHRLEMVTRAIAETPQFELSTIEIDRPGPHYTFHTLGILRKLYPDSGLVFLLGGDSLRDLPTWNNPSGILQACRYLGVMRRPGDTIDLEALESVLPGIKAKVRFVNAPLIEISSSEIRKRIADGVSFRYYLHPTVYDYIERNNLYR